MSSTRAAAVAEEIEGLGSWVPDDAVDLHETLKVLHQIEAATQTAYQQISRTLEEQPGLHPGYAEALAEHAGHQASLSDDLEQRIGRGITG